MSEPSERITIVSGLPRSGTSVMMQMLVAGGMAALTDGQRVADEDNPRGYYELERAKKIKTDRTWLEEARGKAVKMVHLLLLDLPPGDVSGPEYAIVFMRRDLDEVVRSQRVMLERSGKSGAALTPERLMDVYRRQIEQVLGFVSKHPRARVLEVDYRDVVADATGTAARVAAFVGGGLDVGAMAAAVDSGLYRNRGGGKARA